MHGARLLAACRPKVRPVAIDLAWLGGAIGFCLASSYNAPLRDSAEPRQSCQIARARALSLAQAPPHSLHRLLSRWCGQTRSRTPREPFAIAHCYL